MSYATVEINLHLCTGCVVCPLIALQPRSQAAESNDQREATSSEQATEGERDAINERRFVIRFAQPEQPSEPDPRD